MAPSPKSSLRGEEFLAALVRNERLRRPPFFGSIVRGEMNRESDGETLVEFAGRKIPMDPSGLTNRGLSGGGRSTGRRGRASPLASAPP